MLFRSPHRIGTTHHQIDADAGGSTASDDGPDVTRTLDDLLERSSQRREAQSSTLRIVQRDPVRAVIAAFDRDRRTADRADDMHAVVGPLGQLDTSSRTVSARPTVVGWKKLTSLERRFDASSKTTYPRPTSSGTLARHCSAVSAPSTGRRCGWRRRFTRHLSVGM